MKRILVISDTHIPERAEDLPEKIIPQLQKADMVIHAGDLVSVKVLDGLKKYCPEVHAVYGNMDPLEVRKLLSEKEVITVGKHKIGVMHGIGAPVNLVEVMQKAFKDDKCDVIVFGHSHSPLNEKKGEILFFNPGSLTDKIFAPYNSYGILEINDKIEARIEKL